MCLSLQVFKLQTIHAFNDKCRDRTGYYDVNTFRLLSCASCYGYLFPQKPGMRSIGKWVISLTSPDGPQQLVADVHVTSSREAICRSLSRKDCQKWIECCLEAERCCQEQLEHSNVDTEYIVADNVTEKSQYIHYIGGNYGKSNKELEIQVCNFW